ncbi:hypothetical protein TUM17560_26480 [Serratia marcescens]|jgi:hypothetical protein|nr:hypothetical protein TUM17560_26480 [Serratia marcescens]
MAAKALLAALKARTNGKIKTRFFINYPQIDFFDATTGITFPTKSICSNRATFGATGGGNGSGLHNTVSWDDNRKIKSAGRGRATGSRDKAAP